MERSRAVGLTMLAAVLWGTSFPVNSFGLAATDPWTFMATRFLLAAASSAAVALALRAPIRGWLRNQWVWGVAVANALSYQLQFFGQQLTTPGAASLMVNVGNLAVPLFAFLVLRERLQGAKGPAVALAALGVVLVSTGGDPAALAGSRFQGNLLTLAAGLSFAMVIVLQKGAVNDEPLPGLVAAVTGLTALLGLPGALLFGSWALPAQALSAAAYTGVVCTTLAFLVWSAALRHTSSVVSGLVLLLEILVALALALVLGLEQLGLVGAIGAACILGAIALVTRTGPEPAQRPAAATAPR